MNTQDKNDIKKKLELKNNLKFLPVKQNNNIFKLYTYASNLGYLTLNRELLNYNTADIILKNKNPI
jgi:hypothetical protein